MSKYPGPADYPLLEDHNHEVIDHYGIYNPAESKPGLPYPATYIIDKAGIVLDRYLDAERYTRASNEWVHEGLKKAGAIK
jgi:peroxiredoxin